MTDAEILAELGGNSLLNTVRRLVSAYAGRAEQRLSARRRLTPFESRQEEFAVAQKIIDTVRAESEARP